MSGRWTSGRAPDPVYADAMVAAGPRLGIDYGSSNTVVVIADGAHGPRPVIFDGSPLLPSAVFAESNGTLSVGRDALQRARLDPARFEPSPKRRVDERVLLLGTREIPVTELVAATLRRAVDEATRVGGGPPAEVTLTCPAAWGATRRLALLDAAEQAGLGQVTLLEEPVAAARYFAGLSGSKVAPGAAVVVYDLGAGTFESTSWMSCAVTCSGSSANIFCRISSAGLKLRRTFVFSICSASAGSIPRRS